MIMGTKIEIFRFQKRQFRNFLEKNTVTCSMAAAALRIPQKNLTRYKRELQDEGLLAEVFHSHCKLTGFRAAYLTTNEKIIKTLKNGSNKP